MTQTSIFVQVVVRRQLLDERVEGFDSVGQVLHVTVCVVGGYIRDGWLQLRGVSSVTLVNPVAVVIRVLSHFL